MYDTILVPTDGSDHAFRAAEHARSIARRFDATLSLLTVVDLAVAGGPFDVGGLSADEIERLKDKQREAIRSIESELEADVRIETEVTTGRPGATILESVEDIDADLIAMGTHGRSGVRRAVAGSVAEYVVRRADVPVVTVRATERSRVDDGYRDVLVPTDGSDAATAASAHGIAIADAMGARIHAVHVVNVGAAATTPSVSPPTSMLEDLESAGQTAVGDIAERATDVGVEARTEVRHGAPAGDLLEYADEHDIDLIAMGTAGRTGLDRYLIGSTTEKILRRAEIPVLSLSGRREG